MNMNKRNVRVSNFPLPIFNTHEKQWDVISLPDNLCTVNPIPKASKKFKNFIKNLQKKQDLFNENLGAELYEINKEIEETIVIKCKVLKKDIRYLITKGLNNISYNLDTYQTDILTFDDYKFEQCKKFCSNLIIQGKSKIYDFYAFLKSVEKFRSDKFREVFTKRYDDLLNMNLKSPYEIQLFFEEHILAYNQIVLTNIRNYKEIEAHLILVYINEIKLMFYKIIKYEEAWKDLCKQEIINRLKEFNISEEEIENLLFKDESILNIIKLFNNKIEFILAQMEEPESKPNVWLDNMNKALDDLDSTAKQLINVYKLAADELYNKYYAESETVIEKMINKKISSLSEINEIHKSLEVPLKNFKRKSETMNVDELNKLWTETVEFVVKALYTKFAFMEELETIFLSHEDRLNYVEVLIIQEYKQLILKHDNLLQSRYEAPINIILDNLRKDSTKNSLYNTFKRAQVYLTKMQQALEKQKDDQLKVAKKFYDYSNNELILLITELKLFIDKYADEPKISATKNLNEMDYTSMFEVLIQTREHFNEIDIWKYKIIKNIELLIVICKQEQQNKAEQWVSEQEEYITTNFGSKLDFHRCRYDRIKNDIFDVRLAELEMHAKRFTSHNDEVLKCIENLTSQHSTFENTYSTYAIRLYDYVEVAEIEKLETDKDLEMLMLTSQTAIQKESSAFEDTYKKYTENIDNKVNNLYSQNLLFLKSIKLFHEGGNFSSAELKLYTKKMRQLNTLIKKKTTALNTKVQNFYTKIYNQLQEVRVKFAEKQKHAKLFIDFKNNSKNQIINVQTAIKKIVVETKTAMNKTQTLHDRVLKLTQMRNNPYVYLKYVIRDCKELNEHFSQHRQYLEDFDNAPKLRVLPAKHSSTISTNTKKSNISLTKSTAVSKHENHKLFDNETELDKTENKFLSKIRTILLTNFHDLEKHAKKFYAAVKREDCVVFNIAPSLRSFTLGVLHKFAYYYLQCLQIWIIEIRDFVSFIHNLRIMLREFCEWYIRQVHENQLRLLKTKCNKYLTDVKQNIDSAYSKIKYTSDQLKPLYGYPGNQKLLDDLNKQMTNVCEEVKSTFNACVIEPKQYVETVFNEYLEILINGKDKIEELYRIIPERSIYETLAVQVKNIMLTTNFGNLIISFQCTETIDNSELDIDKISEILVQIESPRSTPEELKQMLLQVFADILKENIEKLYSAEFEFFNTIPNMKSVWNENVGKVIELYKIKYI